MFLGLDRSGGMLSRFAFCFELLRSLFSLSFSSASFSLFSGRGGGEFCFMESERLSTDEAVAFKRSLASAVLSRIAYMYRSFPLQSFHSWDFSAISQVISLKPRGRAEEYLLSWFESHILDEISTDNLTALEISTWKTDSFEMDDSQLITLHQPAKLESFKLVTRSAENQDGRRQSVLDATETLLLRFDELEMTRLPIVQEYFILIDGVYNKEPSTPLLLIHKGHTQMNGSNKTSIVPSFPCAGIFPLNCPC